MNRLIQNIIIDYQENGFSHVVNHVFDKIGKELDGIIRPVIASATKNKGLLDCIIIESHNDFDCNGGAFYNYLLKNNLNSKYKIIWLIKNKIKRNKLPKNVKAYYFKRFSFKKNYYITRAKYLLSDDFVTDRVRSDQISVYCTHGGCTFKNVRGKIVVPSSVNYILSSSKNYDPYMCDNYSIPYPNNRMLHIGFPSNDVFFENTGNEFDKFSNQDYSKRILWMPTFRKGGGTLRNDSDIDYAYGIPLFEEENDFDKLNQILSEENILLVIKLHPMQDLRSTKRIKSYSNIFIADGNDIKRLNVDNYRLMASADAFISDYSSAPYSYILLDRPIAFITSDIDFYKVGFTVDNVLKYMPGNHIDSISDFYDFILQIRNNEDPYKFERRKLVDWLYEVKDGNSCERLASFLGVN